MIRFYTALVPYQIVIISPSTHLRRVATHLRQVSDGSKAQRKLPLCRFTYSLIYEYFTSIGVTPFHLSILYSYPHHLFHVMQMFPLLWRYRPPAVSKVYFKGHSYVQIQSLPRTYNALRFHSLRVYGQCQEWIYGDIHDVDSYLGLGWEINRGKLCCIKSDERSEMSLQIKLRFEVLYV